MEIQALIGNAKLPLITIDQILSWGPRKEAVPFAPKEWRGTILDILNCDPPEFDGIKRYDWLLWVVLRNECFPDDEFAWKLLRLFACDCAERTIKKFCADNMDKNIRKAIEVARKYAYGEATITELAASFSDVKAAYVEARAAVDASAEEAESRLRIRAAYAGVDPVDFGPADAYAAVRTAVRAYIDGDRVDNAAVEAYADTRILVRAYAAEAARAACNAVADARAAAQAAANAARADFHASVYIAARVDAIAAAEAAMETIAGEKASSVLASGDPLQAADAADNGAIYRAAEEAYTSAFVSTYNTVRAKLDSEERLWQVTRLIEMLEPESHKTSLAQSSL